MLELVHNQSAFGLRYSSLETLAFELNKFFMCIEHAHTMLLRMRLLRLDCMETGPYLIIRMLRMRVAQIYYYARKVQYPACVTFDPMLKV